MRRSLPRSVLVPPLLPYVLPSGHEIRLLAENLQWTGSYKIRAAYLILREVARNTPGRGAALASSGNFAAAFACAGKSLGVSTTVVMMERTKPHKVEAARRWGARVVFCDNHTDARTAALHRLEAEEGLCVIDHMTDPRVVSGHATLGVDLLSRLKNPSQVLVPVSTGGLLAGVALAVREACPPCRVIGVQSEQSDAATQSFEARKVVVRENIVTDCDALTANRPGELPLSIMLESVDRMVRVKESSVRDAVVRLAREAHLVVEPGGAVGLSALLEGQVEPLAGTVVVLSGGNVDMHWLAGQLT